MERKTLQHPYCYYTIMYRDTFLRNNKIVVIFIDKLPKHSPPLLFLIRKRENLYNFNKSGISHQYPWHKQFKRQLLKK